MDRLSMLLSGIDKSMKILEIGPGYNPAIRKADGWNVWTIDHATRKELLKKYAGADYTPYDMSKMEEIDFIFSDRSLHEAIPAQHHGTFDAVIASHVIEHYPDLIGFFETSSVVLKPDGILSLAIPDKRYLFDAFRPLASAGQALQAHHEGRLRHTRQTAFDNIAYNVTSSWGITWGPMFPPTSLALTASLAVAKKIFDDHGEDVRFPYQDYHCWIFTPSSFLLVVKELAYLGSIDFRVVQPFPTEGCEFFCSLRQGRETVLDEAAFTQERLDLLMKVCIDLGAQTEYILPLVGPTDTVPTQIAVPMATVNQDQRITAIARQLAIAVGRLDVHEARLHQMHKVFNWPRRASRKVRKKIGRWLLADTRVASAGRRDG